MTTTPWLDGTVLSAKAVMSGKPKTMPPETTTSRAHWPGFGGRSRVRRSAAVANVAAITPRVDARNSGDMPLTAMRVSGTVNENAEHPNEAPDQA